MAGIRSDYIERMVAQLAEAIARILNLRAKEPEKVEAAICEACESLLGMDYRVLSKFDPASVAQLLGAAWKVRALAALVEQDARRTLERSAPEDGHRRLRQALGLREEAQTLKADAENGREIARLKAELGG